MTTHALFFVIALYVADHGFDPDLDLQLFPLQKERLSFFTTS